MWPEPVERLAILRVDADLYESTRDVLDALYGRVSNGGYVVIDDYWAFEPCRSAVDEFLSARGERVEPRRIDWFANSSPKASCCRLSAPCLALASPRSDCAC